MGCADVYRMVSVVVVWSEGLGVAHVWANAMCFVLLSVSDPGMEVS